MIAALSGKVLLKSMDRAIIDVAGVGYEVHVSTETISRLPDKEEDTFLHIHTHVREDAIVLYGFLDEDEKEVNVIGDSFPEIISHRPAALYVQLLILHMNLRLQEHHPLSVHRTHQEYIYLVQR